MTTDTVLTDDYAGDLWHETASIIPHCDHHIFFARAIEQAVLQSPEVQRLREDAARYRWLRSSRTGPSSLASLHQWVNDDCNPPYTELKHGEELDTAIDAAIEKQP